MKIALPLLAKSFQVVLSVFMHNILCACKSLSHACYYVCAVGQVCFECKITVVHHGKGFNDIHINDLGYSIYVVKINQS